MAGLPGIQGILRIHGIPTAYASVLNKIVICSETFILLNTCYQFGYSFNHSNVGEWRFGNLEG